MSRLKKTTISALSMLLAFSMAAVPVSAETADNSPESSVTANVTIRGQYQGNYLGYAEQVVVDSNLAESYGYKDGIDPEKGVSAFDALVALHQQIYGEDFTEETKGTYLTLNDYGYVERIFGTETWANGFLVNGGCPNDGSESMWGGYNLTKVRETSLADGDIVDFFIYWDSTNFCDLYTFAETDALVYSGCNMNVNVKGQSVMAASDYGTPEDFKASAEVIENAGLAWVDSATGKVTTIDGAATDKDGNATITAPSEPGSYYLTACGTDKSESYLLMNPVKVNVSANPSGSQTSETAENSESKASETTQPAEKTAVAKTSVSKASVKVTSALVYNGKSRKPAVTVTVNGKKLKAGRDYTVSYTNNKNVGKATVKVTGTGNYTGTKTASFVIKPKKAAVKSITVGKKKMTVKTASITATGGNRLQLAYRLKGKSSWKTMTLSSTGKVIKSLKAKKYYQVKVRAFKKVGSKTYYGSWSKIINSKKIK